MNFVLPIIPMPIISLPYYFYFYLFYVVNSCDSSERELQINMLAIHSNDRRNVKEDCYRISCLFCCIVRLLALTVCIVYFGKL